jgi:hypothetical protein
MDAVLVQAPPQVRYWMDGNLLCDANWAGVPREHGCYHITATIGYTGRADDAEAGFEIVEAELLIEATALRHTLGAREGETVQEAAIETSHAILRQED